MPEDSFDPSAGPGLLYGQALVCAQSRIASPFADVGLLAGGVVAAVGELGWFLEGMAARRDVALSTPVAEPEDQTVEFLVALTYSGYPAQIVAEYPHWNTTSLGELGRRPGAQPYPGVRDRWTTDAFRSYVGDLQTSVDRRSRPPSASRTARLRTPSSG